MDEGSPQPGRGNPPLVLLTQKVRVIPEMVSFGGSNVWGLRQLELFKHEIFKQMKGATESFFSGFSLHRLVVLDGNSS